MELRVVVKKETVTTPGESVTRWAAQILDYDLATQARDITDLIYEVQRLVCAHVVGSREHGIRPFQLDPAPEPYHALYARGRDLEEWSGEIAGCQVRLKFRTCG